MIALSAIARLLALSRSAWDWDEALFISAVRDYDVTEHHPHPPGFPLFIASAKVLAAAGLSEFRALQTVVLIAAILLVPAMLLFGREIRFPFEVSIYAALFCAFMPNVWVYGGTAFSDLPSMVLVLLATGLLLRGCRDDRALLIGGLVLGAAIAFRTQNLAIGMVPAAIAAAQAWKQRRRRQLALSIGICVVVVALSYGIAAYVSHGFARYLASLNSLGDYLLKVDSYHNPARPPLPIMLRYFFVRPFLAPAINAVFTTLGALGLILAFLRPRVQSWCLLAIFGPFCIFAWLYLDFWSISRYGVTYAPLLAFLSADALLILRPRFIRYPIAAGIIIVMIVWTTPVISELHRHRSPPAEAAAWIAKQKDPHTVTIWSHGSMAPHMDALLPQFHRVDTGDGGPPPSARIGDIYIREGIMREGLAFTRPRRHTEGVVRRRYFEVSITPVERFITFADGWYQEEGTGLSTWDWMGNYGKILFPRLDRPGILTFSLFVPMHAFSEPPTIVVTVNGTTIDRFIPKANNVLRKYRIEDQRTPNQIEITTTQVAKPKNDPRLLGVRLDALDWSAAPR
ncbi:MAG TPA: glycosyltransferase family 39 protein [Thermoanaerobaculia bacterium]|nr:glycosyltransferase family 39 protein [Thermoanaerobaculia bacterium]